MPGKVMVAGGYLVLERPNVGLVLTSSARFYCRLSLLRAASASETPSPTADPHDQGIDIAVHSPQFEAVFHFTISAVSLDACRPETMAMPETAMASSSCKGLSSNTFLEHAIFWPLVYLRRFAAVDLGGCSIQAIVEGDNDFYSQRRAVSCHSEGPVTMALLRALPLRNVPSKPIAKTGLGSSAALVTSVAAAVLAAAGIRDLQVIHMVAQFAHCAAQGKIGSGFDVASAVFGSQVYVRFDPSSLQLLASPVLNHLSKPWKLPAGCQLVCGDVAMGSNTPSMVAKVLEWRRTGGPSADSLWKKLAAANAALASLLADDPTDVGSDTDAYAHSSKGAEFLNLVRVHFQETRALLKEMGVQAGVPVEPDEQTRLLDATVAVDPIGVLAVGVPGAGGFDACFAICRSEEVARCVEEFWLCYHADGLSVTPLLLRQADQVGLRISSDVNVG